MLSTFYFIIITFFSSRSFLQTEDNNDVFLNKVKLNYLSRFHKKSCEVCVLFILVRYSTLCTYETLFSNYGRIRFYKTFDK